MVLSTVCLVSKENQTISLKIPLEQALATAETGRKDPGPQNECYVQCCWTNLVLTVNLKMQFPLLKQRITCPHWVISTLFFSVQRSQWQTLCCFIVIVHPVYSIQSSTAFSSTVWTPLHSTSPSCITPLWKKPGKGWFVFVFEWEAALSKFLPITQLFSSHASVVFFPEAPPFLWSDSKCLLSCPTSRLLLWPPIPFAPLF